MEQPPPTTEQLIEKMKNYSIKQEKLRFSELLRQAGHIAIDSLNLKDAKTTKEGE